MRIMDKIVLVELDKINPYSNNPRLHTKAHIAKIANSIADKNSFVKRWFDFTKKTDIKLYRDGNVIDGQELIRYGFLP